MVTKSANYCNATPDNPFGLMILSEVALGEILDLHRPQNIQKLRGNYHSVRGCGRYYPDAAMSEVTDDDVIIPLGTPCYDSEIKTTLNYNEYIVYDVAQVNIKYLLKIKFDFKKK